MADVAESAAPEADTLSADDQAYFDKRGEVEEAVKTEPEPVAAKAEKPAKEAAPEKGAAEVKPEAKAEGAEPDVPPEAQEEFNADGTPKNPGRWVPHGALHEERTKRKESETQLRQERESRIRVEERLTMMAEALQAKPQPQINEPVLPDTPPDPEQDVFAAIKWLVQQQQAQKQTAQELRETVGKTVQMTEAQRAEVQMAQTYQQDAARFVQTTPEFSDAYRFLLEGRDAEYQAMGIADPAERAKRIYEEEKGLVEVALQTGVSPSERIYNLAKARGFRKPEPVKEEPKAEPAPAASADLAKLENIERGLGAAKSLSSAAGSGGDALSFESLDKMPEAEFAAMMDKMTKAQRREFLGG